jgi:aminobenzoyl-glutamate utilization protein B
VCGSKPVHAAKGYYDSAVAFISYHPHFTNTAILDTQCGAYWSAVFTFETTSPRSGSTRA